MSSLTFNSPLAASSVSAAKPAKPSFFARLTEAMIESRMRKAEIEIRRARAMIGEPRDTLDYALLPFAGE